MKRISGAIFWCGLLMIGILAIPTVVLLSIISAIWKGTDFLLKKFGA